MSIKVSVIMGSISDWETMKFTCEVLDEYQVPYEKKVVSAHRTPDLMFQHASEARKRGIKVIIAGAGGAAHLIPDLGGKTPLQYASIPAIDRLAREGVTGQLQTVQEGYHPGSEVANMAILGYDMDEVYEGRGVLEAANMGVELAPGELAMRCNLVYIEGELLVNHSAGHVTTEEARILDHLQFVSTLY